MLKSIAFVALKVTVAVVTAKTTFKVINYIESKNSEKEADKTSA